jgi:hypothetical protein
MSVSFEQSARARAVLDELLLVDEAPTASLHGGARL